MTQETANATKTLSFEPMSLFFAAGRLPCSGDGTIRAMSLVHATGFQDSPGFALYSQHAAEPYFRLGRMLVLNCLCEALA
jgi:hypothetical protein